MLYNYISKALLTPTLFSISAIAAQAACVAQESTFTPTPGISSGFQISTGDSFLLSDTNDNASTNLNTSTRDDTFDSAFIGLAISPEPGNTGSWDGSITIPSPSRGKAATTSSTSYFKATMSEFSVAKEMPINDPTVVYSNTGLINDTGIGQSVSNPTGGILNSSPGNFESATLNLDGDGGSIPLELSAVPEPNSFAFLTGVLLLGLAILKKG